MWRCGKVENENLERMLEAYQKEHNRLITLLEEIYDAISQQDLRLVESLLSEELFGITLNK